MSNEEPKAEPKNAADNGGTTDEDYRWKWLSTVWVFAFGLGYPLWIFLSSITALPVDAFATGTGVMWMLNLVWAATAVYVIGPENVKAVKELRGK